MARKATAKATASKKEASAIVFAHVFEESCMSYYGTYSGTEEEVLAQIEQDLRENENDVSDYIVMFGPLYQLRAKGIELEKVDNPHYLGGIEMR